MSELGKMDIPEDIFEVIQSSIPDGQAIRHVGLMFNQSSNRLDRITPATEYFLAVTDSFLVYITTRLVNTFLRLTTIGSILVLYTVQSDLSGYLKSLFNVTFL